MDIYIILNNKVWLEGGIKQYLWGSLVSFGPNGILVPDAGFHLEALGGGV